MERCQIRVSGLVQGVGFRPFVYRLASRLQLRGSVRNGNGDVLIDLEGDTASLNDFVDELTSRPPPLARIEHVDRQPQTPFGQRPFFIDTSDIAAAGQVLISADVATCAECLADLFDPANRRFEYPFLNCTNCGPRLTIVTGAPYDRPRTTLAGFEMCAACRAEYENPADRRFHAQPIACPQCGPRLSLVGRSGAPIAAARPLDTFARALRAGQIGALKGLGGFHLACDATNEQAVCELRRRKNRDEKPLAVMVASVEVAETLCEIGPLERKLLTSRQAPIVLLRKRRDVSSESMAIAESVAPGDPNLGVLLPYTPLHHLLLRALDIPLVMTSGNRADEPIACTNEDALERLSDIADIFLMHDRPIHVRADDSVTRVVEGAESPVRRSRGYAPQPIALPHDCAETVLAVGGQFKNVFALASARRAFLSQHLGDLDHYDSYRAFVRDIELYEELFDLRPRCIAHDLHPDYASTRYAIERADREGLTRVPVQHHHAHLASCMAEHGLTEPVIGVAFDGTGYGTDGAIWGGEFLVGDYRQFRRAAHLRYVGMPGGAKAIHEPWRMAFAHLRDAGHARGLLPIDPQQQRTVTQMLDRRVNCPWTSSAGRLFDAVAALCGVRCHASYEGQPAMELKWLAAQAERDGAYPFDLTDASQASAPLVIDTRPLVRAVAADVERNVASAVVARRFHDSMVDIIAGTCGRIQQTAGLETVALSGGVFMNALLTRETCARLTADGFTVYRHRCVPPNDGGLSLGQAAIAAASAPATEFVAPERNEACA